MIAADLGFLVLVARQQDGLKARGRVHSIHELLEKYFAFRIVIMGFIGRGPNGDDDVAAIEFQFVDDFRIGFELRRIDIFFDAMVSADSRLRLAMQAFREQHLRDDLPARPDQRRRLRMLVIHHHDSWNSQQVAQQDLAARAMRQAQRRPFTNDKRKQLQAAPRQAPNLHEPVLAVVPPNLFVLKAGLGRQLAHLKGIASRQNYGKTPAFQFPNDGLEKRNVRCVI